MTTMSAAIGTRKAAANGPGPISALGRRIVHRALSGVEWGRIELVDDRGHARFGDAAPGRTATIRVHDARFYAAIALGGSIGAAESFMHREWEADDLPLLIEILSRLSGADRSIRRLVPMLAEPGRRLAYRLQRNTRWGSRRNIAAHYDLSNEFFSLFLDRSMTYSSAIFADGCATLEAAQQEKIDRACRRLRLKPSDHLLEIGTGWGALAVHAATEYGCRVTTTTISERQHEHTAALLRERGLEGRVTLLKKDYRDLGGLGRFDKLVSIEMIEAVGAEYLPRFFAACSDALKPDGVMLLQAITIRDQLYDGARKRRDFLKKYIFPGSFLPSVRAMTSTIAAHTDMRVAGLDEFGLHYARTLAEWRSRYLSNLDRVRELGFDDRFVLMWEFYLSYCEGVFRSGRTGVAQLLIAKPGAVDAGIPVAGASC